MKTSHTKADLEETGNAITVNSPFLQVQHFFCHCALCGEGYNNYSQLSKHENEQHNFKCNECDESFMIETELKMYVTNKHGDHFVQCDERGLTLQSISDLTTHKENEHIERVTGNDSRTSPTVEETIQAENVETNPCVKNCVKCDQFHILEKEHIDLKNLYDRLKVVHDDQSMEKQKMLFKLVDLENKVKTSENLSLKLKKEYDKKVKEMDGKVNEINSKLVDSYAVVQRRVQENVKLSEEVKTLKKIL